MIIIIIIIIITLIIDSYFVDGRGGWVISCVGVEKGVG